jgi:hypothetical protein
MRAALLLVLLASCSKSDSSANASPFGEPGNPRDAVIGAWKNGGLTPSPLTPASVAVGKDCQSGTVGAVDVLLCTFGTPEEAKAAEDAGLGWVGEATGASQAYGKVLVVVADRRKADPSGRTINQMMKLAPK